ncbi:P-loop NTPase fold protein [Tenacibaculum halocynthiae]|uniref:P-loop NTPase fold protein n=1 Tax=Tenacibaculum halocynthiae TaxID=1254437 RepID=UPI0038B4EC96
MKTKINFFKRLYINSYSFLFKNKKVLLLGFLLITINLLFLGKFSRFLGTNISVPKSDFIEIQKTINWIYLIFTIVFIIILYNVIKLNYRLSRYWYFWTVYISVIYIFLRKSKYLDFHTINSFPLSWLNNLNLYYSDVIFLLPAFSLLVFLKNIFTKAKNNTPSIYLKEDLPLNGTDSVQNEKVIDKIVKSIDGFYPEVAFVIGINAKWGKGKTSFLNRLKKKLILKNKDLILFDFNAWQHQDEKTIINNFFGLLSEKLSKYNQNASDSIQKYLNSLLALEDNTYSKGLKQISQTLFSDTPSINSFYLNIQKNVKDTGKQIIVFVDDLDRLNKEEINEAIRLLRNIANFNNIIFICGLDRSYLERKGELEAGYLDKIFNLEINLPEQNEKNFLEALVNYIKKTSNNILDEKKKEKLIETLYYNKTENTNLANRFDPTHTQSIFSSKSNFPEISIDNVINVNTDNNVEKTSLNPSLFFDSIRDVKKFYNKLIFNLQILEKLSNINIYDYILFHLLIFKYPWMYELFNDKIISQWLTTQNGNELIFNNEKYKKVHSEIFSKTPLNNIDSIVINTVLDELFNKHRKGQEIRINQKRYLPIYLNNNIFNDSLNYSQIIEAIDNFKVEKLIEDIKNDDNEIEYLEDIKNQIIKRENLQNLKGFKELFLLINNNIIREISSTEIVSVLAWALNAESGINKKELKTLLNTIVFVKIDNRLGLFLRELNIHYTNNKGSELKIKSPHLIRNKNHSIEQLELIDKEYVKEKLITLFSNFLKETKNLSSVIDILHWCVEYSFTDLNFYLYYQEISNLFKEYLSENLKEFIEIGINNLDYNFLATIFSNENKDEIIQGAIKVSNSVGNLTQQFNPYKIKFIETGLNNFIDFLNKKSNDNLSKDIEKIIKNIEKDIENGISL